jgi:serine O-acetyltransferase
LIVSASAGWKWGLVAAAIVACAAPAQIIRLALRTRRRVTRFSDALAYGAFMLIGKWANLLGQYRFLRDRAAGRRRLIEYRNVGGANGNTHSTQSPKESINTGESRMRDPDWQADLERYPPRPFLREQSVWALAIYRFGRRNDRRKPGLRRKLGERFYWLAYRIVETFTGISIPKTVEIGPGLRIHHFGNIFIHSNAKIGAHCTLRQGVTIGNRREDGPIPVIEDDVELGAYAQILGGVRIGRGARIGAMTLVLTDVPPGATAIGVPAKIMETTDQLQPALFETPGVVSLLTT